MQTLRYTEKKQTHKEKSTKRKRRESDWKNVLTLSDTQRLRHLWPAAAPKFQKSSRVDCESVVSGFRRSVVEAGKQRSMMFFGVLERFGVFWTESQSTLARTRVLARLLAPSGSRLGPLSQKHFLDSGPPRAAHRNLSCDCGGPQTCLKTLFE